MRNRAIKVAEKYMNLYGEDRDRIHTLRGSAEDVMHFIRLHRAAYETYLYMALGRKVSFDFSEVVRGQDLAYLVKTSFIVSKGSSEPLAPRMFLDIVVTPKDGEFAQGYALACSAGFMSAIGMRHEKFNQASASLESLEDPAKAFGWVEYLDGDFLGAKRVVRPFSGAPTDMGTV